MNRCLSLLVALGVSVLVGAGCHSQGLSAREGGVETTPTMLMSIYDSSAVQPAAPPAWPIRVAVAQVGEVAPPPAVLDELTKHKELFSRVEGIPGMVMFDAPPYPGYSAQRGAAPTSTNEQRIREALMRMRRHAQSLGADYLLVYGGSIDSGTTSNGLSLLDWTIVGAFVVPGHSMRGEARATGALLDVTNGAAAVSASASASDWRVSSAVSEDANHSELIRHLRDKVSVELAKDLVERCNQRRGAR